jgi:BASS family bile acid:Na+ symporter
MKKDLLSKIKPWVLPIAMVSGVLFHNDIGKIAFLSPYLIFIMLLITYCKVSLKEFRVTRIVWIMLAIQVLGAIALYLILRPIDSDIAQGAFICVFCPTATAAPVVTGMLGGSVTLVATYSILSNAAVAFLAPVLFSLMGVHADISLAQSMLIISTKVFPLIMAPLALAMLMQVFAPRVHRVISQHQSISFYVWAVALFIVVGNAVSFIVHQPVNRIPIMLLIAFTSLVTCCGQFYVGRKIGGRFGDKVSGAQGLGQKNTVLAIWMALTYLDPVASVGPAAYVAWQNTINSLQLFHKAKEAAKMQKVNN